MIQEYALVGPADEVKEIRADVDPAVPTKSGWRWLPFERVKPTLEEGKVLSGPSRTVEKTRVVDTWTLRDKTAGEIDGEKLSKIDTLEVALLTKLLFTLHNRVRVLEGQSQHTMAQFRNFLKAMI